jgi:hypothetical protein
MYLRFPGFYPCNPCNRSALSRNQSDLLVSHFDRIILMLDGDVAG